MIQIRETQPENEIFIIKMGICYHCTIRCLKVKDLSKVELRVIESCEKDWEEKIKQYYLESRLNIKKVFITHKHEPSAKGGHRIVRVPVPEGTNVIAFGNDACDCYDMTNHYEITFYDAEMKVISIEQKTAKVERNNFMIIIPPGTCSIDYQINDNATQRNYYDRFHDYQLTRFCNICRPEFDPYEVEEDCSVEDILDTSCGDLRN